MKINEASVIDNKVIDDIINIYKVYLETAIEDECGLVIINSIMAKLDVMEYIKQQLKPLEPIVRDVVNFTYFNNDLWEGVDQYINQTEI